MEKEGIAILINVMDVFGVEWMKGSEVVIYICILFKLLLLLKLRYIIK